MNNRTEELSQEVSVMRADYGSEYTLGYLLSMLQGVLPDLGVRHQQRLIQQIRNTNGDHMITVINCLSGQPVQIRRADQGGCTDPSTERYHSM
jgi:hypothetical protein